MRSGQSYLSLEDARAAAQPGHADDLASGLGYSRAVFDRESVRALDRRAIDELGVPGAVLMEHAAASIEALLTERFGAMDRAVVCVCGPGNNGGDGLAVARRLYVRGHRDVRCLLMSSEEKYTGDAGVNLRIAQRMGVRIERATPARIEACAHEGGCGSDGAGALVVDALFGTGLTRAIEGEVSGLVRAINRTGASSDRASGSRASGEDARDGGCTIVSVDVPSGMDADTGGVVGGGACVCAHATITLAGWKKGLLADEASEHAGQRFVGSIGLPDAFTMQHATGALKNDDLSQS